jgi:hypothetical protein
MICGKSAGISLIYLTQRARAATARPPSQASMANPMIGKKTT